MKADPDVIAVIDSILAEAGDERAPVKVVYCTSCKNHIVGYGPATIQGWIDRLRGIRAALEEKE